MQALTEKEYQFICDLIYKNSKIALGPNKKELVSARLSKRLRAYQITNYSDYCTLLKSPEGGEELVHLVDAISTNHTYFFREIKHFEFLNERMLPEWSRKAKDNNRKTIRIWSCASSSGEEPYSIGITLEEYVRSHPGLDWSLETSDISTRVLGKARDGIYAADRLREVKPEFMSRYFQKGTGTWEGYFRVKEAVRSKVRFHHLNLLQPMYPFQTMFDTIFCRNVMIYFDRATQEELIDKLYQLLEPGGYLMIGHSESLTGIKHSFVPVQPAVYLKK